MEISVFSSSKNESSLLSIPLAGLAGGIWCLWILIISFLKSFPLPHPHWVWACVFKSSPSAPGGFRMINLTAPSRLAAWGSDNCSWSFPHPLINSPRRLLHTPETSMVSFCISPFYPDKAEKYIREGKETNLAPNYITGDQIWHHGEEKYRGIQESFTSDKSCVPQKQEWRSHAPSSFPSRVLGRQLGTGVPTHCWWPLAGLTSPTPTVVKARMGPWETAVVQIGFSVVILSEADPYFCY